MKNILILGGTGFLGKNIVEKLIDQKYNIFFLVRNKEEATKIFPAILPENFVQGDLKNTRLINNILDKNKIDIVIHLVSNLIPSSNKKDFKKELIEIILPTITLSELLSEKNIQLVFFSSGGTIYADNLAIYSETNNREPINYYGQAKLILENYILFLNKTQNLNFLILRPSNVYGKHQKLENKQGLIAVAIGKAITNSTLEIWGDGETIRDFVDVADVSNSIVQLINYNIKNEIFNIGSGTGNSINEVINSIETITNKKINVIYKSSRKVDKKIMVLDIQKIKKAINFNPIDLHKGILKFIKEIL